MAIFKPKNPSRKRKKEFKTTEFRIYTLSLAYSGELELLTTIVMELKDVFDHGRGNRPIALAAKTAEEFVRNIGLYGITVEDPEGTFNYYPPSRIGKVEYRELDD